MKVLVGSELGPDLPKPSTGLVAYDGFRQYPLMDEEKRKSLALGVMRRHLASDDSFVAVGIGSSDQLEGIIIAERFPWGEKHFHMGMAHVQQLLVNPENGDDREQRQLRKSLLARVRDWAERVGVQHLAGRFPTEDYRTIQEVEAFGGRLMDTIATYTYNCRAHGCPKPIRRLFQIREYEKTDREDLLRLSSESFVNTRFSRDPTFHREDVKAFYREWGERLCAGEMAQRLLVATNSKEEVMGFIGYRLDQDLHKWCDIRVRGGGLGAVSPRAAGAYMALLHESFSVDYHQTELAEVESQIQNSGVIKIWHKLRCQPVRVTHTMHIKLSQ